MKDRQQSSTSYPMSILLVLASDHVTGATGLTPTVTISKNGAAFGSPSGAVTEIASGWYSFAGNATDRNTLGELLVHVTGTGADPFDDRYTVVPWNPFDANQGLTNLDAAVSTRSTYAGGAVASVTAAVTVGTNNDKTGYALTAGEHTSIASDAQTGLTAQGYTTTRAGYLDTLNGLVAAIWASGTRTLTSFGTVVADAATAVWAFGARTLSGFGFTVTTDVSATVTTNLDTTVGSRSTYAGTDTPGTTTLLTRVAIPVPPRTAQQKQFDVP